MQPVSQVQPISKIRSFDIQSAEFFAHMLEKVIKAATLTSCNSDEHVRQDIFDISMPVRLAFQERKGGNISRPEGGATSAIAGKD
jgi:hypothetical protein